MTKIRFGRIFEGFLKRKEVRSWQSFYHEKLTRYVIKESHLFADPDLNLSRVLPQSTRFVLQDIIGNQPRRAVPSYFIKAVLSQSRHDILEELLVVAKQDKIIFSDLHLDKASCLDALVAIKKSFPEISISTYFVEEYLHLNSNKEFQQVDVFE